MTSRRKKAGESGKRGSGSGGVKGKAARAANKTTARAANKTTARAANKTTPTTTTRRSTRSTRSAKKDDGGPGTTNDSKKKGRDADVINSKDVYGQILRKISLQQQQETTGQGGAVAGRDGLANHLNHPFLNRGSGNRSRRSQGGHASQGGWLWPHRNSGQALPRYPPGAPRRNNPLVGSPGPLNETPRMDTDHMYEVNTRKLQMLGLAPGLDLYGTNEGGGLTELFHEGEEKEEGHGSDREVEQRVDENELDVKENENELEGNENELDGNGNGNELEGNGNGQTPASVQTMMQRMRGRLREQEAYIQELEDQILKLNARLETRDLTT